jgi:4-hydroxy-tetrahydrodipicolinate synthase
MRTFGGAFVALATPFREGALDEESYRSFIGWQLDQGIEGLVPMGTTGEAATLTPDERARAVRIAVEEAKGRVPVIAGAGTHNTAETVQFVRRVRELGADGALIVLPYYNKPTQAGIVEHFRAIARENPGFPLVPYNVPSRTAVDLLPETCLRLTEIAEVVALKEATASMSRVLDIIELCGERLSLLSGDDATVLPFIACGGQGVISVSANLVPSRLSRLVRLTRAGELAAARQIALELEELHRLLFVESNPIPVKWALHLMGRMGPEIRLPLTPLSPSCAGKLRAALDKLSLLA